MNGIAGGLLRANGFPENFIKTNPQFNSVTVYNNLGTSNYQSMQAQITVLPTHGFSLQSSYTLSKNLGYSGTWTDLRNRSADYTVLGAGRRHTFTTYGTLDLPLGSKGLLFRNSKGVLERWIEGWQMSWVGTIQSGITNHFCQ